MPLMPKGYWNFLIENLADIISKQLPWSILKLSEEVLGSIKISEGPWKCLKKPKNTLKSFKCLKVTETA